MKLSDYFSKKRSDLVDDIIRVIEMLADISSNINNSTELFKSKKNNLMIVYKDSRCYWSHRNEATADVKVIDPKTYLFKELLVILDEMEEHRNKQTIK